MESVSTIRDLVNLWPKRSELAQDMCQFLGGIKVTTGQVHKWTETGSIPPKYHQALLLSARGRGFEAVTADLIVALHAPVPGEAA